MKTFNLFNLNRKSSAMVQADGCTAARQKIGVNPRTTSTIGRFASVLCLILTMLFTLGVGQMWAGPTFSGGYAYFYNKGGWSDSYKYLCIGKGTSGDASYTEVRSMTAISNTKLWYNALPTSGWGDATYMAVIGHGSSWGNGKWGTSNLTNANHRTASVSLGNWGFNSGNVNMLTPASGSNDATLSLDYIGNAYSSLNISQTINVKVTTDGGSTYSTPSTSPATISFSSKTFSSYTTCGTTSSGSFSGSTNTMSKNAGYTATTEVSYSSMSSDYTFVCWHDGSSSVGTGTSYTYYPTGAKTITARFTKNFPVGDVLYLLPNSDWKTDGARFAAYFYGAGGNSWVDCSRVGESDYWSVTVPSGNWGYVIFCRMNGADATNDFNNSHRWNQTDNLMYDASNNGVEITGWNNSQNRITVYDGLTAVRNIDAAADAPTISNNQTATKATTSITVNAQNANTGYVWENWTSSNGSFGTATNKSTTFTPTAKDAVATANYKLRWYVTGNDELGEWTVPGSNAIGNISTTDGVTSGYVDITLAAHTDYELKMYDLGAGDEKYVGYASDISGSPITYANSGTAYALNTYPGFNFNFTSAGAGTYRFTRDFTNNKLTITYPTAYTVTYHDNGSTSGSVPTDPIYYGSGETVNVQGNTGSLAKSNYTLSGWNTTEHITGTTYGSAGGATFTITGNTNLYAKWTQTITLDRNSGTTGSTTATATYNCSSLTGYTAPTRTGYTFGGYYTGSGGTGTLVINTSGVLQANVSGYTGTSGYWTSTTARTLYAKWTINNYTLNFSYRSGESLRGTVAAINTSTSAPFTNGQKVDYNTPVTVTATATDADYKFDRWYNMASGGSEISTDNPYSFTMPAADKKAYAHFVLKTTVVTFNTNGGSGGTESSTFTHGSSITSLTPPAKDSYRYTFDGYWTAATGGVQVIDKDLAFVAGVSGYTTAGKKWDYDDPTLTLYAHWTQTVTLDDNGGSADGSVAATYLDVMGTPSAPTYADHTVDGYYAESGCTTLVMAIDGTLESGVSGWTNSSRQWIHSGTPTLYAHWKVNAPSISCTDNVVTMTVPTGSTVYYTTNGSKPTGSSTVYDPSNKPTIAANTTFKAIAIQSGCTNSDVTTQACTYTPVYTVTHTLSNVTKTSGDATVLENKAYTSVYSGNTGYNLPSTITVTIGGSTKTVGTDYTWAQATGTLNIPTNKITGNVVITVTGVVKQCTVTFNKDGGEGGDDNVTATYGSAMTNVSVPHKIGYKFAGYWDGTGGTGTQYYNANGTSARTWNKDTESATTLYAKWTSDTNTFTGATNTNWSTNSNWSSETAPTNDYSTVTISSNVTIADGTTAHVGEILISAGSLTIQPGGALEVAGTIKKSNGDPTEITDIIINTSDTKQASLILDNSAADTKATVLVTSTAAKVEDTYSFQYIAVPMTSVSVQHSFSGQGIYTYVWNEGTGWERRNYYYDLYAFEGVGLTQASASGYGLTGTLATTNNQTFALKYTSETAGAGMNMIGNSWTSPISIAALHGKITGNATSTVYVYDSKTGEWPAYPTGSAGTAVVPAMQAYLILATSGGGSLQLNYDEAVRGVASANRTPALRAPKREVMEMSDIYLHVSDNNVSTDLRLCEAEQFTNAFDNGWEAIYIEGEGRSGQLYAQTDEKMAVLATPSLEGTVVGFIPGNAANYTISFSGTETGYYLNDMLMEQSTLITEGNTYEFVPDENTNATRFVISKTPIMKTPTGVEDNEQTEINNVRKLIINDKLYIIRAGRIYNATGALVK